jgi:protocatechuate 3,4-dioxygenase beta subunit
LFSGTTIKTNTASSACCQIFNHAVWRGLYLNLNTISMKRALRFSTLVLLAFCAMPSLSAQISGNVFKDFNFNGTQETASFPIEPGAFGVEVRAYNAAGAQLGTTKTTGIAGTYSFTAIEVPSGTAVRIEFTPTNGNFSSRAAAANGTNVQFITAPSTTVNYAIANQDWYSATANPYLATTGYTNGNALGGGTAGTNNNLYLFPYDMGNGTPNDGGATRRLPNSQLGAVFGLAVQKTSRTLLMAAYLKRHSSFGPNGIGAIYRSAIDTTGVPSVASLLVNVSSIGINVGTDPRTVTLPAASNTRNADVGVFAQVGKRGIGGIDISEDGTELYFVNMFQKSLHRINIGNPIKASITAADVTGNWTITDPSTAGTVWRPMACKTANGKVYVGGVVVREKTTNHNLAADTVGARGIVYEFDPATASFTEVLRFPFNYRRGFSNGDFRYPNKNNWWCAWQDNGNGGATDPMQADYNTANGTFTGGVYYPQPMLADIEFDVDGSMILGIRDRFCDQMGYQNLSDDGLPTGTGFAGANNFFRGLTSGELLRAGKNLAGSAFTLESRGQATSLGITTGTLDAAAGGNPAVSGNWSPTASGTPYGGFYGPGWGGTAGTIPTGGPNPGTQGGYFYFNHNFSTTGTPASLNNSGSGAITAHYVKSNGGLALLAGSNEVVHTLMDPVAATFTQGAIKMFNSGPSVGNMSQRLQLVTTTTGTPGDPTNSGKAGGLGDLEVINDYQPIEIGNRVWTDADGDGVQDAGAAEAGINGVAVDLVSPGPDGIFGNGDDVVVATTTTATINGQPGSYFFSTLTTADARKPAGFTGVGNNNILPGFNYQVRINTTQAALANLQLTKTDAAANSAENIDNDAVQGGNFATITLNTANANHNYDFGFKGFASIGDKVWRDDDKDGIQDAGEPGVTGITVTLYQNGTDGLPGTADDVVIGTTVTDAYGNYLFDNLTPTNQTNATTIGQTSYNVGFTLPANYTFTTSANPNQPGDNGNNINSDANATTGRTGGFNLATGERELTVDAGVIFNTPAVTASVGDRVWFDTNGNGTQDTGEPGVSGVTVTLYNGAGQVVGTTVTDANGNYLFTNVAPGTGYTVGFTPPAGTLFTSSTGSVSQAANSDANPATGRTNAFNVASGEQVTFVDAGLVSQPTSVAALGDRVWYDNNRDGDQDAGEPGVAGVTVNLFRPGFGPDGIAGNADDNNVVATRVTDGYGNYIFNNLTPGIYTVTFVAPAGHVITGIDATGGTAPADGTDSDANPATGGTTFYALPAGAKNLSVDCGIYSNQPAANVGALGNFVWNDLNGDGIQDAGEPGMAGITVILYNSAGNPVDTVFTDANGAYLFTNLAPGNYTVGFGNLPPNFGFTGQDRGGNDATDSDVNPGTGRTGTAVVTAGATNTTVDAGIRQGVPSGLGSLGNRVWYDLNNNGLQDAGEPGVAGVTVTLLDAGPDGIVGNGDDGASRTTVTNALGEYLFGGLPAGNYMVQFGTAAQQLPAGFTAATANAGTNDNIDSDGGAIATGGAPAGSSRTGVYNLAQGEDNLSVDLGLVPPANTNTVSGQAWFDNAAGGGTAGDGIRNGTEVNNGVAGILVTLYNNAGVAIATTTTDANGNYSFVGVANGTGYTVGFSNYPPGVNPSPRTADGANNSDADRITGRTGAFNLTGGTNITNLDAGMLSTRAALGNFVWSDLNGNGVQDAGEPGVPGVTVSLFFDADNNGSITGAEATTPVATAITDANGAYFFPNLQPGNYQVGFSTIPVNTVFTQQNTPGDNGINTNSDAAPGTGLTGIIALAAGEIDNTIDAGIAVPPPATIGNRVWADLDKNGLQDLGEPGIAGVLVTLFNSSNVAIGSAITDGNGNWQITNVPAGTGYYLVFTPNIPNFNTTATPGTDPAWTGQNIGPNGTNGLSSGTESDTDSDVNPTGANPGRTGTFNIAPGNNFPNMDAGIINWPFSSLLPVPMYSFTAQPQGGNVLLNWQVGTELNLQGYEVAFSTDGSNWTVIGTVAAAGRTGYSFVHTAPVSGFNYYRIKSVDRDGKFTYSEVRRVNFGKGSVVAVYPNPVKDNLNITVTGSMVNQPATISIVAMDGKLLLQRNTNAISQTESLNVSGLANGKYIVRIVTAAETVNKPIEVIK